MIIHSLCNSCLQPFHLIIETADVPLVKEIADDEGTTCPCPRLCGGAINLVGEPTLAAMAEDPRLKQPVNLTGRQLYQAVNGLGLPDEIPRTSDTVDAVLRANKVVKTVVEEHQGKVYLHELHLENGSVLHLASGTKGSQVLKIVRGVANGQ